MVKTSVTLVVSLLQPFPSHRPGVNADSSSEVKMSVALEPYGFANVDEMLLCERKLLYLRFIGASRGLIDRVFATDPESAYVFAPDAGCGE